MSNKSSIEWCNATWNALAGCTRVSAGCDHCYAFALHDMRYAAWKHGTFPTAPAQYHRPFSADWKDPATHAPQGVQLLSDRLADPLHWTAPRRVFVNSMSDLFHESVPDDYILRHWAVMALTPHHTFQILTKRPERMRDWVRGVDQTALKVLGAQYMVALPSKAQRNRVRDRLARVFQWPLPNVHLGVSVEDQRTADDRIPVLEDTPAAVRFLSCEPLLGRVYLGNHLTSPTLTWIRHHRASLVTASDGTRYLPQPDGTGIPIDRRLDWVIVGGESGRHARSMDLDRAETATGLAWVRELVAQCRDAGVPVFVKQLGTVWAHELTGRHPHGANPDQWPEDLRIREYPVVAMAAATSTQGGMA